MKTATINTEKLLNSYALVRSSWIKDDFISSFIPLAATIINNKNYDYIDVEEFCKDFSEEYGIEMPTHPAIKLLSLMQKGNMISFVEDAKRWKPNYDELSKTNIGSESSILMSNFDEILNDLSVFFKDIHHKSLTIEQCRNYFYEFIQSNSDFVFKSISEATNSNIGSEHRIVADYILNISKTAPDKMSTIKQISIGRLLVDALRMEETHNEKNNFKNVTIFLDTRIILNMIGFYGEYREKSYTDLIDKLHDNKASLKVFRHTWDEINYILKGCEEWIESPEYNPELASSALRYLKTASKDKKYVQGLIVSLDAKFKKHHITIEDFSIEEDNYKYQIDRIELKNQIESCYRKNNIEITERVDKTIECDIKSIEAIYHIRKEETTTFLNNTRAFLLTTNRNLVYASKLFSKKFYGEALHSCIGDISVGTYVWARAGISYCEGIIETKLISDCSVAMEPSQHAIVKFCSCIDELKEKNEITEAEYIALRCYGLNTEIAKPILVSGEDFRYTDIHDVLEEIKQDTIKREKEKYDAEKSDFKKKYDELLKENEINKSEFEKYKKQAEELYDKQQEKDRNEEMLYRSCADKAEKRIKRFQIWINATVNISIQIIFFIFTNISDLTALLLRITIPVVSLIGALIIQYNVWDIKDAIKLRLIVKYKAKLDSKREQFDIKKFYK